ncbi:hypothetical protein HYDPIDRAFT_173535 [Hydnomerulius pinastri MD-312]|nr:hypothetical protein HYDPIDRAFT_173535 [Hydnomerulius pinastri MD-312]
MTSYVYELPTTGAISFADVCIDTTQGNVYTPHIAEVTQARANLRGVLKESKRTESGDKDYLRIIKVLDDYIPQLYGIMACVASGEIRLRHDPIFSWRTTLSSTLFNTSPRVSLPTLHADLSSTLLTYAFALSNFSHSVVSSLGSYETERAISDKERKEKDERLNFGVTLLCRASGVFAELSDGILGEMEREWAGTGGWVRPPDLGREVNAALAKMALADAQTLAIRKLLSKSAFDSTFSPGPPLPKSHPSTALLAKLHLECATLYSSARTLAMTPAKAQSRSGSAQGKSAGSAFKSNFGSKTSNEGNGGGNMEVSTILLKYLAEESAFHSALAHKWLGVDAGESGNEGKGGEAVGFLIWAKKELDGLHSGGKGLSFGKGVGGSKGGADEGKGKGGRKKRIEDEMKSVGTFLEHYKRINDSLTFNPVPSQASLQALIPTGRLAVSAKPYAPSDPAFGPGSRGYSKVKVRGDQGDDYALGIESLKIGEANDIEGERGYTGYGNEDDSDEEEDVGVSGRSTAERTYVGAGSYF